MVNKKIYIGGATITIVSLFTLMVLLGANIQSDGDKICAGTIDNPCVSFINITTPVTFYVYNKEGINLTFSPEIKDYKLYIKDGRYSKTCFEGICGWKEFTFGKTTTFTANKKNEFALVGYKFNPTDKIKWGINALGTNFDPIWYSSSNLSNANLNNIQCEGNNFFCHSGIQDSSVVGYWGFDVQEQSDNITYDYSPNHNDGTVVNATWNSSDKSYIFTTASNNSNGTFIKINFLSWTWKSYQQLVSGVWKNFTISNSSTYVDGVSVCPGNMSYINKLGGYCIDKYEASTSGCEDVGNNCASAQTNYCTACTPTGSFGTTSGVGTTAIAYSKQNVAPLVRVSQLQSRQMCANAGKHLCTDQEWLGASNVQGKLYNLPTDLAVSPYKCITGSSTRCNYSANLNYACNTSYYVNGLSNCSSAEGVYDMTGNVWEWTNETVNTTKSDLCNPTTNNWCYINSTSMDWQLSSTSPIYGNDGTYFGGNSSLNRAVRRGGIWNSDASAGPFCAGLNSAPSNVDYGIGFRCCSGLI